MGIGQLVARNPHHEQRWRLNHPTANRRRWDAAHNVAASEREGNSYKARTAAGVGEIAGIARSIGVIAMAVLDRPHGTSRIGANTESQPIEFERSDAGSQPIQRTREVSGQT